MKFYILTIITCTVFMSACGPNKIPEELYIKKIAQLMKSEDKIVVVLNGERLAINDVVSNKKLKSIIEDILRKKQNEWREEKYIFYASKLQFLTNGIHINIIGDGIIFADSSG